MELFGIKLNEKQKVLQCTSQHGNFRCTRSTCKYTSNDDTKNKSKHNNVRRRNSREHNDEEDGIIKCCPHGKKFFRTYRDIKRNCATMICKKCDKQQWIYWCWNCREISHETPNIRYDSQHHTRCRNCIKLKKNNNHNNR